MAIAKMKIDGKWVNLYANEINSRLKISENLADVANKAIARENLELVGDITTHNHDSIYLPLIQQMTGSNAETSSSLVQERQERIAADEKLESEIQEMSDSLGSTIEIINNNTNTEFLAVEQKLNTIKSRLDSISMPSSTVSTDKFMCGSKSEATGGTNSPYKITDYYYNTKKGFSGTGTYELKELLKKLTTLAHTHEITENVYERNCVLPSDCSSSGCMH